MPPTHAWPHARSHIRSPGSRAGPGICATTVPRCRRNARVLCALFCLCNDRIVGMAEAGARRVDIAKQVLNTDGQLGNLRAVDAILAHARADPAYAGTNSSAGGRRRELSPSEETQLQRFLEAEVGVSRVTIPFCRKRLPFLRRLSQESAQQRCSRSTGRRVWRTAAGYCGSRSLN